MKIIAALATIQSKLSELGIAKNQQNNFSKYNFRGIDDIYNAMSPLLAQEGVVIASDVVEHTCAQAGKGVRHIVKVEYTMYLKSDPTNPFKVTQMGEGGDTGDKGLMKAVTAAYKNMVFQTFCIPVEPKQDAEFTEGQNTPKKEHIKQLQEKVDKVPNGLPEPPEPQWEY